jgi:putative nucleotidyltransferase with HDIG domain
MAKCILGGVFAYLIRQLAVDYLPAPELSAILVMLMIYVATNQILLGLALWIARGVSFQEAGIFRDAILIELPLACVGYLASELFTRNPLSVLFILAPMALIYQAFMLPKVQGEAMKALESMNKELTEANGSILRLNDELFQALAKVFDMRDPYVGGHAAQVATYAVAVAEELGLPLERIELVRRSAFLHDIGKLAIPESILHKAKKLTEIEYEFIKKHADIGADLLTSTEGLKHLAPFIRHHHERWDGCGYPLGLAGDQIPLESRILNLCDSVESMASDRPYHQGMTTKEIIDEIRRCRGTQFDPAIADIFVKLIERHGPSFVINSARSVTQQYAASLLTDESTTHNMFEWLLEMNTEKQAFAVSNSSARNQSSASNSVFPRRGSFQWHKSEYAPLEI